MRSAVTLLAGLALLSGCGASPRAPIAARGPFRPVAPGHAPVARSRAPAPAAHRFLTARLLRRTQLRFAPDGAVLATLRAHTEFGSPTVLSVLGGRAGWLRVLSATQPNGHPGWIPADAAALAATDVSLVVERGRRRLLVRRGSRVVRRVVIAVGRPGNETPLGRFAVTDLLRTARADSPYGCCALALTGHQTRLEPGWPGGDRLAVHGTPADWSVGRAVSLGCMRARRPDMAALLREVPLGAPVFIRA